MNNNTRNGSKNGFKQYRAYTTGKVAVFYCHIAKPWHGTEKYPDTDGKYMVTARLDEDQLQDFKNLIAVDFMDAKDYANEAFSKLSPATQKRYREPVFVEPWTEEYDRASGNATGYYTVKFKANAIIKPNNAPPKSRILPLFDSVGQPLKLDNEPGDGSLVKIAFKVFPYFINSSCNAGVSLKMSAVQILFMAEGYFGTGDKNSPQTFGFQNESDTDTDATFVASDMQKATVDDNNQNQNTGGMPNGDFDNGSEDKWGGQDDVPF